VCSERLFRLLKALCYPTKVRYGSKGKSSGDGSRCVNISIINCYNSAVVSFISLTSGTEGLNSEPTSLMPYYRFRFHLFLAYFKCLQWMPDDLTLLHLFHLISDLSLLHTVWHLV
jgi:hypothetical protein